MASFGPDKDKPLDLLKHLEERRDRYKAKSQKLREENQELATKIRALQEGTPDEIESLLYQIALAEREENKMSQWVEAQLQADTKKTEDLKLQISQKRKELLEKEEKLILEEKMQATRLEDQKQELVSLEQQILECETLNETMKEEQRQQEVQRLDGMEKEQEQRKQEMEMIKQKYEQEFLAVYEQEKKKRSQLEEEIESLSKEYIQNFENRELEHIKVKRLSQAAIKMRIIAFKLIRQIQSLKEVSERQRKINDQQVREINKLKSSGQDLLDTKEHYRQILDQKASLHTRKSVVQKKLQQGKSKRRTLERDLNRALSVLRDVAKDPENPEAREKLQKVLQILDTSELQQTGTSLDPSSRPISGELKTPTLQEEDSSSTSNQDFSKEPLFLMAKLRPGDLSLVPGPSCRPGAAAPSVSSRRKLPCIKPKLWSTALHKWMDGPAEVQSTAAAPGDLGLDPGLTQRPGAAVPSVSSRKQLSPVEPKLWHTLLKYIDEPAEPTADGSPENLAPQQ